jgi:hypothetical protein
MPLARELSAIVGAQELYDWLEKWPRFHDAEIVSRHLNRRGPSLLLIHTWDMANKVDERGCSVLEKRVVVEFIEDIRGMELDGFRHQNVISSLDLEKKGDGFVLVLDPCYEMAGTIEVQKITIGRKPGKPSDRAAIDSVDRR